MKGTVRVSLYFLGAILILFLISRVAFTPMKTCTIYGFAQGGIYRVVVLAKDTAGLAREIADALEEFENSVSLYRENSLISRINRNETDELNRYMIECIEASQAASAVSDGLFDITIKPLTKAFGFAEGEADSSPNIDSLLLFVGYGKISIVGNRLVKERPEVQIDLNALSQGYSADMLARILNGRGIRNYMIEIGGGEIYARGTRSWGKPWRIGIETPFEGNFLPGEEISVILGISDKGVATSGNYRKFSIDGNGRKHTHIINPVTGENTESNLLSATVIADDATTADIYGTICMVMGFDGAKKLLESRDDLMGYLIYDSLGMYRTYCSPELRPMIRR